MPVILIVCAAGGALAAHFGLFDWMMALRPAPKEVGGE